MILLFVASCKKDAQMLTIINEDGTCIRELTKHVNPRYLIDSEIYPDNGKEMEDWEQTWSWVGDDTRHPLPMTTEQYDSLQRAYNDKYLPDTVLKHYRREFKTVEEMSNNLPNSSTLKVEGSLEKHFKWFYTDYVFKESFDYDTCQIYGKNILIPLNRFISADTASYWFTGHPDLSQNRTGAELKVFLDEIEGRISRWINANLFAGYCNFIAEEYDSFKDPPVSKELFIATCDSLAMTPTILEQEPFENDIKNTFQVINNHFKTDVYTFKGPRESTPKEYTIFGEILTIFLDYDLVMPGKVLDPGMGLYDGEVIHYRLTGERLIPGAYTITATSRVTNVWAFIATLLIILLAIGSFFYRKKK